MSDLFSNLFYGGIVVFVGYELYECYKEEGELNMVTIPKCFFEGLFGDVADEATGLWNDIKEEMLPKPTDTDKTVALGHEIDGYDGVYYWYNKQDVAVSMSREKLENFNPGGKIEGIQDDWDGPGKKMTDAEWHRRYGGRTDASDPQNQHHDFTSHPYYQTTGGKLGETKSQKEDDKNKHNEGFFDKIFKPSHWF